MLPSDRMVIWMLLSAGGIIVVIPSIESRIVEEPVVILNIVASMHGKIQPKQQRLILFLVFFAI